MHPEQLRVALAAIPATAWSKPSTFAATGVHHGYRRVALAKAGRLLDAAEPFRFALEPFAPVWDAWLSSIDPGGFVVAHRDAGPHRERWQVPVTPARAPFRVSHWEPHEVRNTTDHPRVHVVIDRDVVVRSERTPFELLEVPCPLLLP